MAESPKSVIVGSEPAGTPQEEVGSSMPGVETEAIPESSGAAPVKVGGSPPPSPSPMTPEEKTEDRLEGDIVVKEPAKKKTRLQFEVSGLADRVEKACESMNGLSAAMVQMCERFQKECAELHAGLNAMGLQGISNKGMLAAMVTYENTLRDINWQISGSGKAQTNNNPKAICLALGDKIVTANQTLKELSRTAGDHHKSLIEQLQAIETAIKASGMGNSPAPGRVEAAMPAFGMGTSPGSGAVPGYGAASAAEPMTSYPAMPMPQRPQEPSSVFSVPMGTPNVPIGSNAVPAAFSGKTPATPTGQASAPTYPRRAYRVVVQTGQGSSKVRAISPSAWRRATENPPAEWHQAYGLGDVVIRGWRHRVLPDSFIAEAVQYPEI